MDFKSLESGSVKRVMAAVRSSINLALFMQVDHPEDAREYLKKDKPTIVDEKEYFLEYDCFRNTAIYALGYSLRGLGKPSFGFEPFRGLITNKKLLERLAIKHRENGSEKGGNSAFRNGVGVHAWDEKEYADNARRCGAASMINRGRVPISDEERETTYALYISPDGPKHLVGRYNGMADQKAIARFANDKFHGGNEVRSNNDIICIVRLEKERLARRAAKAK